MPGEGDDAPPVDDKDFIAVYDVADLALALSAVTALRVFGPGAWMLIRRLLGATVRIGAESLAEQRTAGLAVDAAPGAEEKGSRR